RADLSIGKLVTLNESQFIGVLRSTAASSPAAPLVEGLFGDERALYKRLAQYSYFEEPEIYQCLARRPYADLVTFAERIAGTLAAALGTRVDLHDVLVDAPPTKLEVDFDIDVYFAKQNVYRRLGEISPVVRT